MFDNPQQEVNNMSKKLRPVKLSDEAFELFYKEIYAEFGPKDVPPVELNPKMEVPVEEPEVAFPAAEEPVEEPIAEQIDEPIEDIQDTGMQEEILKAAAMIRNVHDDEIIDADTDGVKLVKSKKEKGVGGLIFTICLELLAIAGIIGYWLVHIL